MLYMKRLSFHWKPAEQEFACDGEHFQVTGLATTDPSHDLVHLILAANGGLPWMPLGEREQVCFAEYNAVLLENIYDKTYNSVTLGMPAPEHTIGEALKHLRWFVEQHYHPFPVSAEEAYRRFCRDIDAETVTRLFPYYFDLKRRERQNPGGFRNQEYRVDFTSEDDPVGDESCRAAQKILRQQVKAITA